MYRKSILQEVTFLGYKLYLLLSQNLHAQVFTSDMPSSLYSTVIKSRKPNLNVLHVFIISLIIPVMTRDPSSHHPCIFYVHAHIGMNRSQSKD